MGSGDETTLPMVRDNLTRIPWKSWSTSSADMYPDPTLCKGKGLERFLHCAHQHYICTWWCSLLIIFEVGIVWVSKISLQCSYKALSQKTSLFSIKQPARNRCRVYTPLVSNGKSEQSRVCVYEGGVHRHPVNHPWIHVVQHPPHAPLSMLNFNGRCESSPQCSPEVRVQVFPAPFLAVTLVLHVLFGYVVFDPAVTFT